MQEFFNADDEFSKHLSYSHVVGLISFGGLVVVELAKKGVSSEIECITVHTSKCLEERIKLTWAEDCRSWVLVFEKLLILVFFFYFSLELELFGKKQEPVSF